MAPGRLQLQTFINQAAQDAAAQAAAHIWCIRQPRRGDDQADPLFNVVTRDHLVVDDGRDALDILGPHRSRGEHRNQ